MRISTTSMKMAIVTALMLSSTVAVAMSDHHAVPGHIKAAVESSGRSAVDRTSDLGRKPAAVLAFAGIKPGMTVIDINSGGGYYTELLSHAVGAHGKVIAHNGAVYWDYVKDDVAKRYDGRLANVTQIHNGHEEIEVAAGSVDAAILMIAYHDYFYNHKARTKEEDMSAILASVKVALKDGGSFVVSDHTAVAGSGPEVGDTLHRIDPELVKRQVLAAGFKLAASSDILANPDDALTLNVFDEKIRFKTDRFILKFVK